MNYIWNDKISFMIEKLCFQNYKKKKIVQNERIMYPKQFRHFYSLPI